MWWRVLAYLGIVLATVVGSVHGVIVTSKCGVGRCQTRGDDSTCVVGTETACGCVTSQFGVPCLECTGQGYINGATCACNVNQDPESLCRLAQVVSKNFVSTLVKSYITTTCFYDPELGWFRNIVNATTFPYPGLNPPTCAYCVNDAVGPPVGYVIDDPVLGKFKTCRSFGGPNPRVVNDTSFNTCSGQGTFSYDRIRCECNSFFRNTITEYAHPYIPGQNVVTCAECAPFYAPRSGTSMCSYIATPDPLAVTGPDVECGGHGVYTSLNNTCACFTNSTAGYWKLGTVLLPATLPEYVYPVTSYYEERTSTYTIQSCVECQPGYTLSNGCRS